MAGMSRGDSSSLQLGVAYGFSAGTAMGLLTGNLPYWILFGLISGFVIVFGRHADDHEADPQG